MSWLLVAILSALVGYLIAKNLQNKKQAKPQASNNRAAGWYPDPKNQKQLRYWDGKKWGKQNYPNPENQHTLD